MIVENAQGIKGNITHFHVGESCIFAKNETEIGHFNSIEKSICRNVPCTTEETSSPPTDKINGEVERHSDICMDPEDAVRRSVGIVWSLSNVDDLGIIDTDSK